MQTLPLFFFCYLDDRELKFFKVIDDPRSSHINNKAHIDKQTIDSSLCPKFTDGSV